MKYQTFIRSLTLATVFTVLYAFESSEIWQGNKHRIRHERHKRQLGFYFHQNFTVGPHDESADAGSWGPWTEASECSRVCGGGVASQTRICQDVRIDGTHSCIGPSKRYYSCNIDDCPAGTKDFRELQCARFNTVPFETKYYSWVPHFKAPNPCELNCKPKGERFYYRHDTKVIDGTHCREGSLDVCVDGVCMPVGCDKKLGSEAKEDKCKVCGGDGSSCKTIEGLFEFDNLQVGYNDILLIPAGATNINIEEKYPTNNYLAVRNKTGHYYLNGNWRIESPRELKFSGTIFHYERKHQSFLTPERLWTAGPTKEAIFIVLLYQEKNQGIIYEYSIPKEVSNFEPDTYNWIVEDYEECSVTCGGGIQKRVLMCIRSSDDEKVDDYLCDPTRKPASNRSCNELPCHAKWATGEWLECIGSCGNGKQYRTVTCQQQKEGGASIMVTEEVCARDDVKPEYLQDCKLDDACPEWSSGPWSPCNKACGDGLQTRKITCTVKRTADPEGEGEREDELITVDDSKCSFVGPPPENQKQCNSGPCEGVEWITSAWTGCSSCGLFMESRETYCANEDGKLYPGALCDDKKSPAIWQECPEVTKCTAMWHASEWSECSAKCGVGIQTRVLFCGEWDEDVIKKVDEKKCDPGKKMETIQNCTQPACEGQWFTGPYGRCTAPCGSGQRRRPILCIHEEDVVEAKSCDPSNKPFDEEPCNMKACDDDEVIHDGGCKNSKNGCCPDGITRAGPNFEGCPKVALPEGGCVATEFGCCADGVTAALGTFKKGCPPIRTCNDTKHGCCPDGVTTAEDKDKVNCPEVVDCEESLWGCCPDGVVPAVGANNTGCESTEPSVNCLDKAAEGYDALGCEVGESSGEDCAESNHGCCPDGIVPRTGPNYEGCPDTDVSSTCNNSTYGCCADGFTAAQGANGTGCDDLEIGSGEMDLNCTETFFGCCTDNITIAKGPDFEGCDAVNCSDSEFGCCSDNVTLATGLEYAGCDIVNCTESEFGCCEDNVSLATGPENEGCNVTNCNTTEFGCCQDNTTDAKGPDFEGCEVSNCTESEFGCCPDNTTSAKGTENAGCEEVTVNCTTAEFGCCPDNKTLATGPEHEGCETVVPEVVIPSPCTNMAFGCCPDGVTPARGVGYLGCCLYTTYGCCPDNITEAIGVNYAGCGCHTSKFNCCPDGITLAKGPRYYGCTCETYPYGCCQDNYYPAQGEDYEGCQCTHMLYGCCNDGLTPATGPEQEGCGCKSTQHGCCADNETPAAGPHLEGCPCRVMPFGCCPDGVTVARGSNYEGCPCSTMQFGCCPDNITPARGENQEGCDCEHAIYGCCPDRITTARGPSYYGCPCDKLPFGCCPDGVTASRGSNNQGCPCETSPFNCCPDGVTLARGPNNEGCTEAPKPDIKVPGEVCSLLSERGTCRNYTVKWFFDMNYGGCSRFWYGGCNGNGNTFNSHEECEQVCVSPEGSEACKLPKVAGPCKEFQQLYYYDSSRSTCEEFEYGGCLGNNNRFQNKEICQETCVQPELLDRCDQPAVVGPCRGLFPRFHYNKADQTCKPFTFSGCKGNENNFETERECLQACAAAEEEKVPSVGTNICSLPKSEGPCTDTTIKWYYNEMNSRCEQFYYGGCDGNANRFEIRDECEHSCVAPVEATVKNVCQLPYELGNCFDFRESWYYDASSGLCHRFHYSGCGGNENNFESYQDCEARCGKPASTELPDGMFKSEYCFLQREAGPCNTNELRWYYDGSDGVCKEFYYGGCQGNGNRFRIRAECESKCGESQDICQLPLIRGPCSGNFTQWHYDKGIDSCVPFQYGGCKGNANRFNDKDSCELRCQKQIVTTTTLSPAEQCHLPYSHGSCLGYFNQYYFDANENECKSFVYGGCEGNGNRFETIEECEKVCASTVTPPVNEDRPPKEDTTIQPEVYDKKTNKAVCESAVETGPCSEMHPRWFYDSQSRTCLPFVYGGCGGNKNRFKTTEICLRFCTETYPDDNRVEPERPTSDRVCAPNNCGEIWCPFGMEEEKDVTGCVLSCSCYNPCKNVTCPTGQRCALEVQRNEAGEPYPTPECRYINKPGQCPPQTGDYVADQPVTISRPECQDFCREDSDCRINLKCCYRDCAFICINPLDDSEREFVPITELSTTSTTSTPPPTTTLAPEEIAPSPTEYPEEKEMPTILGNDVTINCIVQGVKTGSTSWSKDDIEIPDDSYGRVEIQSDGSLYISKVQELDSGVYTCVVHIMFGGTASRSYRLVVHVPARILPSPSVVIGTLGQPSILYCKAIGSPLPSVSWWSGSVMLPYSSSRYQQFADFSLIIRSVTMQDVGVYYCWAFNSFGPRVSSSVKLQLRREESRPRTRVITTRVFTRTNRDTSRLINNFTEPWLSVNLNTINSKLPNDGGGSESLSVDVVVATPHYRVGSPIQLDCRIKGYPNSNVQWFYANHTQPLSTDDHYEVMDNNSLIIHNASIYDSGFYRCLARNPRGEASSTISITIEEIFIPADCTDNPLFAKCELIVKARYCNSPYYGRYCCRTCLLAGQQIGRARTPYS